MNHVGLDQTVWSFDPEFFYFVKLCKGPFRKKIASFDTGRYYEVARLGPIFLAWNMVVAKNDKGKVTKQKYKIKKEKVIHTFILEVFYQISSEPFDLGEMEATLSGNKDLLVS